MQPQLLEFRFPDGDFEMDATEYVPNVGDVVSRKGRVWKVDAIVRGTDPKVVTLLPVSRDKNRI